MVFRRREKQNTAERLRSLVYPRGGWVRAARYVRHRLTRLPDPPQRIARGIWAGVLISFTPLFGFHFLGAAALAYLMRGNMVAAILGTFFGNPLTFPLIAVGSVQLGHWILGTGIDAVPARQILSAFGHAGREVWSNMFAYMTGGDAEWGKLWHFYNGLFRPYLIGGLMPGIIAATVCYHLSLPVITAYQNLRAKRRSDRGRKLREAGALRFRARRPGAPPPAGGGGTGPE